MLLTRVSSLLSVALIAFVVFADIAQAGFGITPPYVRNSTLTKNSSYEQVITIVRGNPEVSLIAQMTIDAPEFEDWITILEGNEVLLPAGEQRIPFTVRVDVPPDVDFANYTGRLRIRTTPADDEVQAGAVSIALGAQVQLDLTVIDRIIRDFRVRRITVPEIDAGQSRAWLYFPGKIQFGMRIENIGNVDVAPSRVTLAIYDRQNTLLEETESLGRIETVSPYSTANIVAAIPTRLPAGNYIAEYTIYNDDEIRQSGEVNLRIREPGTLGTPIFGFSGLSRADQLSLLLPALALLITIVYIIWIIIRRRMLVRVSGA